MTILCRTDVAVTPSACTAGCAVDPALRAHHDRLLTVEHDIDELLELLELAVTWAELEYADEPLLGPEQWVDFAATHLWAEPERATRIFSLAADVAAGVRPVERLVSLAG